MAPNPTSHQLTETNLALHDQLLQCEHPTHPIVPWVEKVIKEERIHQFYTSLNTAASATHQTNDFINQNVDIVSDLHQTHPAQRPSPGQTHLEQLMGDLKLFYQRPGMCIESPLERFLTPDGCGTPSYFVRPALENVSEGPGFGSLEGMEERQATAREHVVAVASRRRAGTGGWCSGRG